MNTSADVNSNRDNIRAAIFGLQQRKKIVDVAGVKIEIRQPAVSDIMMAGADGMENTPAIIRMICDYCFVPGTEEKVFCPEDVDALKALPFGRDWQAINDAINELSDLQTAVTTERGNSSATPAA